MCVCVHSLARVSGLADDPIRDGRAGRAAGARIRTAVVATLEHVAVDCEVVGGEYLSGSHRTTCP